MRTVKPAGCATCPLLEKGIGFVPDALVPRPDYVFVGEAPGKQEVDQGKPFVGRAGWVLRSWLIRAVPAIQLALERGKVTIANTLRCLPPEIHGRAYPRGEEKEQAESCCRQYDDFGGAHTIVLFGESSQRYWFKNELAAEDASDKRLGRDVKGVMGRIGREYQKDGRRWIFAPHPAWILRQPALVEHGQQALSIAAGVDKLVDVAYLPWSVLEELNPRNWGFDRDGNI